MRSAASPCAITEVSSTAPFQTEECLLKRLAAVAEIFFEFGFRAGSPDFPVRTARNTSPDRNGSEADRL